MAMNPRGIQTGDIDRRRDNESARLPNRQGEKWQRPQARGGSGVGLPPTGGQTEAVRGAGFPGVRRLEKVVESRPVRSTESSALGQPWDPSLAWSMGRSEEEADGGTEVEEEDCQVSHGR